MTGYEELPGNEENLKTRAGGSDDGFDPSAFESELGEKGIAGNGR